MSGRKKTQLKLTKEADINRRITTCITITSYAERNLYNWGLSDSAHRLCANRKWGPRGCVVLVQVSGFKQKCEAEFMCFLLYVEHCSLINRICIHCPRKCQKSTTELTQEPWPHKTQVLKGHIIHFNSGIHNFSIWKTENCSFFGSHFISHCVSLPF